MSGLRGRQKRPPKNRALQPVASAFETSESFNNLIAAHRAMDRISSTPSFAGGSHVSSAVPLSECSDVFKLDSSEGDFRMAVRDVMDDAVAVLTDAKTRQTGAALTKFYTTISSKELFRRVMLDDIDWRLESCISALLPIIEKGRAARSGSSLLVDAIRAARCFLLLLSCLNSEQLRNNVSGGIYETLVLHCLEALPKVHQQSTTKKCAMNGYLVWLHFQMLGELIRLQLISDTLPDEVVSAIEDQGPAYFPWYRWLDMQTDAFINKKLKQIDTSSSDPLTWSHDDIIWLDGLCLCMASMLCNVNSAALYNRENIGRNPYGFVWRFVDSLAKLMRHNTVQLVNAYVNAMPNEVMKSKSASMLLGLPDFLGIAFQEWWRGQAGRKLEDVQIPESDDYLMVALETFGGKPSAVDAKSLTKNLTKEFAKVFREVNQTVACGEECSVVSINLTKNEVSDGVKNDESDFLIGETLRISDWRDIHLMKICREFGGSHGSLAFAMQMEREGRGDVFAHPHNEAKVDKSRRWADNKKYMKQERQYQHAVKQSRRDNPLWGDNDA